MCLDVSWIDGCQVSIKVAARVRARMEIAWEPA
jgi:hypothetical protein